MHGLALRALQLFIVDCYGTSKWSAVIKRTGFGFDEFEGMMEYPAGTAETTLAAASDVLKRPTEEILEDVGTYIVSHPNTEALRRLLRFGGVTFEDFLHSLDDLPDRAKLAVPDLDLPTIELRQHLAHAFSLTCRGNIPGFGYVLMGILRTMADDYGALAIVDHRGGGQGIETLSIKLLEATFAEGRDFSLGVQTS